MTQWLKEYEGIPVDQHRFCVFVLSQPRTDESIAMDLVSAGVKVSFLTDIESDSVQPPQQPYFCYIEPKVIGVTPNTIKDKLGALAIVVSRDGVPAALEPLYDYNDLFLQEDPGSLYAEAGPDDPLGARMWFGAVGGWDPAAPSDEEVISRLENAGMNALISEDMPKFADVRLKSFMFYTGEQVRSPQGVQQILSADAIKVNKYPIEADRDVLKSLAEGGISDSIAELARKTSDAVKSGVDALSDLTEFQKFLFKGLKYALWGGLGVVVVYVGYRGYKHWKEVSK